MCSHPKIFKNRLVACHKCVSCRKKQVNDWALRLELERQSNSDKSLFITLTYNNENLPENTLLCKRDLQLFFKRLRRKIDYYNLNYKISYFSCGEYGNKKTNNFRPHYHIALFGFPLNKFNYDLLLNTWNKGFIKVEILNFKNSRYVAKYCNKQFQKDKVDLRTGEVISEFVTMSRRVGIGFCKLKDNLFIEELKKNNFIQIRNFKYSIPYSFKRKLKEIGEILSRPKLKIFYNDLKFKTFSDFLTSSKGFLLFHNLSMQLNKKVTIDDFEIFTFTQLKLKLESNIVKEKEYFQKLNKDFYEYYKVNDLFNILFRRNGLLYDIKSKKFLTKYEYLYTFDFFFM